MKTKMQAVMRPGRICGSRMWRNAVIGLAPEVLGRRQLGEIEALERGVQDQRRERDVDVRQDDERPEVVVDEQQRRLGDDPEAHEDLVERAVLAQDRLPRVDPQQVARPERDDDDEQGDPRPPSRDVAGEEVGDGERDDEADDRDRRAHDHGLEERPDVRRVREEVLRSCPGSRPGRRRGSRSSTTARRRTSPRGARRTGPTQDDHRRKERRQLTQTRAARPRPTTAGGAGSAPPTISVAMGGELGSEDLVEELDRLLGRRARALRGRLGEDVSSALLYRYRSARSSLPWSTRTL